MTKSFKEYEHEGWNDKASQYERFNLPLSRAFEQPQRKDEGIEVAGLA
jgi:hypothetical protein